MTKQISFLADLVLLEGTIDGRFGPAKVCIPIKSIKFFMEGRNPKTNEKVTAIVLDTGVEIAFLEPIEVITKQYHDRLNALLLS